jgi:hypothetical protein
LLTDPDAAVRLSAVQALPVCAVLDYCYDNDAAVSEAASVKWISEATATDSERARVAGNMARSPHAGVRWLGELELERGAQWSCNNEMALASEWLRIAADRPVVVQSLRSALRTGTGDIQLAAMMAARRMGLQPEVELELLEVLGTDLNREETGASAGKLLGAAASALGEIGSASALEAVRACMRHPIARVRANAAEALARRYRGKGDLPYAEPRLYETMIEMKDEGHHRVRSSAICAILRAASPECGGTGYEPTAADGLIQMLDDDRPMHRLAGLWAAERVVSRDVGDSIARRWDVMASRVAELARDETDGAVRRRAHRCARRMLARMNQGAEIAEPEGVAA